MWFLCFYVFIVHNVIEVAFKSIGWSVLAPWDTLGLDGCCQMVVEILDLSVAIPLKHFVTTCAMEWKQQTCVWLVFFDVWTFLLVVFLLVRTKCVGNDVACLSWVNLWLGGSGWFVHLNVQVLSHVGNTGNPEILFAKSRLGLGCGNVTLAVLLNKLMRKCNREETRIHVQHQHGIRKLSATVQPTHLFHCKNHNLLHYLFVRVPEICPNKDSPTSHPVVLFVVGLWQMGDAKIRAMVVFAGAHLGQTVALPTRDRWWRCGMGENWEPVRVRQILDSLWPVAFSLVNMEHI